MNDPITASRNTTAALRRRWRSSDRCSMNDMRASSTPCSPWGALVTEGSSSCGAGLVIESTHQWTPLTAVSADVALFVYVVDAIDLRRLLVRRVTGGGIRAVTGRGPGRGRRRRRVLGGGGRHRGRMGVLAGAA